jgi:hypothetical protein
MPYAPFLALVSGLVLTQTALAEVFRCTQADGSTGYSQVPCARPDDKNRVVKIAPPPPPDRVYAPSRDWTAESANALARQEAEDRAQAAQQRAAAQQALRKPAPAGLTDQQIIAQCEAGHGTRCSSAGEIAQRRMEQRELSSAERQHQQNAVAARRQRQQDEAFQRSLRR